MPSANRVAALRRALPPVLVFAAAFCLYAATAAPGTLFGDPSEYQFIPAILGIAHPPGYAFYILLAKLWQTLVPLGTVAFRTNLLAAAAGAWVVTMAYLVVRDCGLRIRNCESGIAAGDAPTHVCHSPFAIRNLPPLFAALSIAVAPDLWQHAMHSNAHIVSAALAATHLWLLVRWWRTEQDRWLFAFAVTVGLAATHHPITLMGVPAYGLFILAVRPRILRQWRTLLALVACALVGLAPLLYYPLRSPTVPFGPTDMRTWDGFVRHVTARGLRVNLFHFGPADQLDRARVFWSLLRLQFPIPTLLLSGAGFVWLVRRAPKLALLSGAFLLGHLLFTLNTVQDVMAYLLLPFSAVAMLAGCGAMAGELRIANDEQRIASRHSQFLTRNSQVLTLLFIGLLLPWPTLRCAQNLARGISLRDFTAAEVWVDAVHARFDGQGARAVLVSDWEHLTPLWVHAFTQGETLAEEDLKPVYVTAASPWAESVWANIEVGPIYLPDYRPAVRDAGFRLLPDGDLYRVAPPPVTDVTPAHPLDVWADARVHILGCDLPSATVRAGEPLALVLYQSAPQPVADIWMPYAQLGPLEARWTTDSRLLTPYWLPGEVVAERYEIPVPFTLPPGDYPLRLGYADLSGGRASLPLSTGGTTVDLATVTVLPARDAPSHAVLERAVANFDNQVALTTARARAGWQTRQNTWDEPLAVRAGQPLHLTLTWRALASPRASQTIFIHLLDGWGQLVYGHDYTPLGGAAPTYLWFPKWLPGQTFTDPYRLTFPDVPPGTYWVEVGMYGMTSLQRLPVVDLTGNLAGDRVILGPVQVEAP
ncbi:MAG: DUF2723 domain-containing protein [Anaerolineae bacterium]|nr:DUF2723 domain-containing protein [Anaerolineae bacterium]